MPIGDELAWPIVGRASELRRIRRTVADGASVLLMGGCGVGRTTLLKLAQDAVAIGDTEVVRVGATPQLMDAAPMSAAGWLDYHVEQAHTAGRDGKRRVLVIDDVHLMDSRSAIILHHLVSLEAISVIATARSEHHLPEAMSRLWVQRLADRIDVPALTRSSVAELLRVRLGENVDAASVDRFWQVTSGNPLLLRELVEYALSEANLRRYNGIWMWKGLRHPTRRLVDVVRFQLGTLDADEAELVNMVALAEPLNADLPSVRELAVAAERLSCRGVLLAEGGPLGLRLRLAFPLCAQVLVATMPELTRWRLRHALADELEKTSADDDLLHAVRLRRDTGRLPDRDRLVAAAEVALRSKNFRLAEDMCRLIVPAGELPTSARLGLLLGQALAGQYRHGEAEAVFAAVACLHSSTESDRLVETRAVNLAWGLHRVGDAVRLLEQSIASGAVHNVCRLRATKAVLWILDDRLREVAAEGHDVLENEDAESHSAQTTIPPAALAHMELGDAAAALDLLERCRHGLERWDPEPLLFHRIMSAAASFLMGETANAIAVVDTLNSERPAEPGRSQVTVLRARIERSAGLLAEAIPLFREAVVAGGDFDVFTTRAWTLAQLAGALAEAGHHAEALRVLDEAHTAQDSMPPFPIAAHGVAMETALVHAHIGDIATGRREAHELANHCAESGRLAQELAALHLAARLGDARAVDERASTLAAVATSRLMHLQAEHIRGLAARDASALAATATQFVEFGLTPLAAETCSQAYLAYQGCGRRRGHRAAVVQCRQLLSGYTGRLPGWASGNTRGTHELTARELQIAAMAAGGSTNRDIAAQLVVSVRTVENHLQRVYMKLGVTSRAQLATSLDPATASA